MTALRGLGRDIRLSIRTLVRERSFSVTGLGILALCLAANVAIFAVVNGVLLKPPPFPNPHQLVLFGVSPANPLVLAVTAAVLAVVALLACALPSRRAARVSPTEALRGRSDRQRSWSRFDPHFNPTRASGECHA